MMNSFEICIEINSWMIQNYLGDPLVKNYMAPTFPLFIALKNSLHSITNKKSMRDAKPDITSVILCLFSSSRKLVLKDKSLWSQPSSNSLTCQILSKSLIPLTNSFSWHRPLKNILHQKVSSSTSQRLLLKSAKSINWQCCWPACSTISNLRCPLKFLFHCLCICQIGKNFLNWGSMSSAKK